MSRRSRGAGYAWGAGFRRPDQFEEAPDPLQQPPPKPSAVRAKAEGVRRLLRAMVGPPARVPRSKSARPARRKAVTERASNYGVTSDHIASLLEQQNGACAICSIRPPRPEMDLVIDHCHTTGKVRGLLCNQCNTGLGMLRDSAEAVRQAADYLSRSAE